jgi:predicted Zn-dependent protease
MKAPLLALALSCLLSQSTAGALAAEQYVSETHSSAGTLAVNATLPPVGFADVHSSRKLSNEAVALLNAAQYDQAESKLRTAISLEPTLASAHCNLGLLLNKTGRAQEAIPHLEYACRQAPEAAAPVVTLAAAYQLCGDLSRAVSIYNEYLQRFPQASDRAVIADIINHLQKETQHISQCPDNNTGNYHWTKRQLKVYVQPAEGLAGFRPEFNQILQESFLSWSASGALNFEFVDNAAQADVECTWTDDVSKMASVSEGGEAVLRHRGDVISHANVTLLTKRAANQAKLSAAEIKTLCLHEVGHALGLMNHSARPDDVMYCTLTSAANPSAHDFSSLQKLYGLN